MGRPCRSDDLPAINRMPKEVMVKQVKKIPLFIIPKEAEKSGARVIQAPSETLSNNKMRAGFSADISMISWREICNSFQRKG